jgi:hypothetical protein
MMIQESPARSSVPSFSLARSGMLQRKCACGGSTGSGGGCEECKKKKLQRSAAGNGPEMAPPIVHDVLRSPGQPLDAATRASMEPHFGHDFSKVRIHADARANESARSVNALAYTVGRQIVFDAGQYRPEAASGRRLLAHELTHVTQQPARLSSDTQLSLGATADGHEREAEHASLTLPLVSEKNPPTRQTMLGRSSAARATATVAAGTIQRQVTFLAPGGGFGGLMERDRSASFPAVPTPGGTGAMPAVPAGSPYGALPRPLLETLWRSYSRRIAGVGSSDKNLDNAFWAGTPKDFWEALDRLVLGGAMAVIKEIYDRWSPTIYWGHLLEVRNAWGGGSLGFDFHAVDPAALRGQLTSSPRFCEDVDLTGGLYHWSRGETPCWRELVSCAPGLHFCLGSSPPSVHIDPTQVVEARESDGSCNYDMGCVYAHFKDLGWVP